MATPYSAVSGGSKDAYNFYHSQLRIQVECAFGMLSHRWAILRSAIPMGISLKKTVALVIALQNSITTVCIDEKDADVAPLRAVDELRTENTNIQWYTKSAPTTTTPGWWSIFWWHWSCFPTASNTGWKLWPYLDSCLVIACMTSLLKPTWIVQCLLLLVVDEVPLLLLVLATH